MSTGPRGAARRCGRRPGRGAGRRSGWGGPADTGAPLLGRLSACRPVGGPFSLIHNLQCVLVCSSKCKKEKVSNSLRTVQTRKDYKRLKITLNMFKNVMALHTASAALSWLCRLQLVHLRLRVPGSPGLCVRRAHFSHRLRRPSGGTHLVA